MFDQVTEHDPSGNDGIVLAQVASAFWMLQGEAHLAALLADNAPYPAPVHCIVFESTFDLMRMLPEGQSLSDLWSIHPDIVARLDRRGELVTVSPSDDA